LTGNPEYPLMLPSPGDGAKTYRLKQDVALDRCDDGGSGMADYIRCDTCPRCYDAAPGELDRDGYHFFICGNGGNMVYKKPRRVKRISGSGYIHYPVSGCGLYKSVEDALAQMTAPEIERYRKEMGGGKNGET